MDRFVWHLWLDVFYPPLYALLLRRRARAILPESPLRDALIGAATLAAACDLTEDGLRWMATRDYRSAPDWVFRAAAVAALIKWMLLFPCVACNVPLTPLQSTLDKTIPRRDLVSRLDAIIEDERRAR